MTLCFMGVALSIDISKFRSANESTKWLYFNASIVGFLLRIQRYWHLGSLTPHIHNHYLDR